MTYDVIMAEVANLLREVDNAPHDAHEIYFKLHAKLNQLRALGDFPVPQDLARFESELEQAFVANRNAHSVSPQPPRHQEPKRRRG